MTDLYTEQTQFALAQWQAQRGYPNSTPASPQSVTVTLAQGTGYKLGDDMSAGLIIGPPAPSAATFSAGWCHHRYPNGPEARCQSAGHSCAHDPVRGRPGL